MRHTGTDPNTTRKETTRVSTIPLDMNVGFANGKHLHRFPNNGLATRVEKNSCGMLKYVSDFIDWDLYSYYGLIIDVWYAVYPTKYEPILVLIWSYLIRFMCSIKSYPWVCFPSIQTIVWQVSNLNKTGQHNIMYRCFFPGVLIKCLIY